MYCRKQFYASERERHRQLELKKAQEQQEVDRILGICQMFDPIHRELKFFMKKMKKKDPYVWRPRQGKSIVYKYWLSDEEGKKLSQVTVVRPKLKFKP